MQKAHLEHVYNHWNYILRILWLTGEGASSWPEQTFPDPCDRCLGPWRAYMGPPRSSHHAYTLPGWNSWARHLPFPQVHRPIPWPTGYPQGSFHLQVILGSEYWIVPARIGPPASPPPAMPQDCHPQKWGKASVWQGRGEGDRDWACGCCHVLPCPEMLQGTGAQPWALPPHQASTGSWVWQWSWGTDRKVHQGVGRRWWPWTEALSPHSCTIIVHWTWLTKHKVKDAIV